MQAASKCLHLAFVLNLAQKLWGLHRSLCVHFPHLPLLLSPLIILRIPLPVSGHLLASPPLVNRALWNARRQTPEGKDCHQCVPRFCPAPQPCSWPQMLCKAELCSEGATEILTGQMRKVKVSSEDATPIPDSQTVRSGWVRPLHGTSNKMQCLELTNKSEGKTIFMETLNTWKYWQVAIN